MPAVRISRPWFFALATLAGCAGTRASAPAGAASTGPVGQEATAQSAGGTVRTSSAAAVPVKTATVATSSTASSKIRTLGRLVVPIFSEHFAGTPIAKVEDEVIPMRALIDALAQASDEHTASSGSSAHDFAPIIRRLVNTRLLMMEARATELDQRPEFLKEMQNFREMTLRDRLKKEVVKDLKLDPERVDKIYKDLVREYKVRSLLFREEIGAKHFLDRLKKGAKFDVLADELLAHKEATGDQAGDFLDPHQALPQIARTLQDLKVGGVSEPLKVPQGYAVLHIEDVRYPQDPKRLSEAKQSAWESQGREELEKFLEGLVKKYAKSYEKKIQKVDFDAKTPGFEALLASKEVLIDIQGDKAITTGDLATTVAENLFHSPDPTQKGGKLNKKKYTMLRALLTRRMLDFEARRRGYHLTEEYKSSVKDHEDSTLVSLFIQRTVAPTVTITEGEGREYYQANIAKYSYPEMFSLDGIWFPHRGAAEAALAKLKQGTDFKWLQANAAERLPKEAGELELTGNLVAATSFDPKFAAALAGADTGEYRVYTGPSGMSCVVLIAGHIPARPQPYLEVRESIAKEVFGRKLGGAIDGWAKKLEKGYKVEIYFKGLED